MPTQNRVSRGTRFFLYEDFKHAVLFRKKQSPGLFPAKGRSLAYLGKQGMPTQNRVLQKARFLLIRRRGPAEHFLTKGQSLAYPGKQGMPT